MIERVTIARGEGLRRCDAIINLVRFARKSLLAFGMLAGVPTLSGCDQFAADPVAFTRVGDVPVVRMSLPVTISSIQLVALGSDDEYTATAVWSAKGSAQIDESDEFALGTAPVGMTVIAGPADTSEVLAQLGERYSISISAEDDYGSHEFLADITAADFDDAVWLNGDGAVDSPCVRPPARQDGPATTSGHNRQDRPWRPNPPGRPAQPRDRTRHVPCRWFAPPLGLSPCPPPVAGRRDQRPSSTSPHAAMSTPWLSGDANVHHAGEWESSASRPPA